MVMNSEVGAYVRVVLQRLLALFAHLHAQSQPHCSAEALARHYGPTMFGMCARVCSVCVREYVRYVCATLFGMCVRQCAFRVCVCVCMFDHIAVSIKSLAPFESVCFCTWYLRSDIVRKFLSKYCLNNLHYEYYIYINFTPLRFFDSFFSFYL